MRPSFRKPEDDVAKRVEERVKTEVDGKIKTEVDKRVSEILKEREDKDRTDKANKIAKAVDVAKAIKGESDRDKDKEKAERTEKAEKKDDILCPTCHTGHLHKMEQSAGGLNIKCVGDKCGKEYVLLDTTADYQCATCGIPIKKPEDPKSIEACPYCNGRKAVKFDWNKIRKVIK